MARTASFYADHILDAIVNIEADIAGHDFDSFRADRRARQLAERNLEIISEASRRLPEEMKGTERGIPWEAIAGIGNMLRHDYHRSHPTVLWETCRKDLAPLKAAVARIRRKLVDDVRK
ncbi:MAG: HepT-like ribonuclease domain-containing protein [Acetobacteraceae bacterium]